MEDHSTAGLPTLVTRLRNPDARTRPAARAAVTGAVLEPQNPTQLTNVTNRALEMASTRPLARRPNDLLRDVSVVRLQGPRARGWRLGDGKNKKDSSEEVPIDLIHSSRILGFKHHILEMQPGNSRKSRVLMPC
jgi:hypothetical protein